MGESAPDGVHQALRDRILSGELPPGAALPSERKLAETFGINRGAVREALQRLAQARLITVHHGGATRVLDYRDAGLDLLADLVARPGRVDPGVLRSVLELRNGLAPLMARLAARRGGPALADALEAHLAVFGATADPAARYVEVRALWRRLAIGAENLALRLALNSLQQGTGRHEAAVVQVLAGELVTVAPYLRLVAAIRARDEAEAAAAAEALVAPTAQFVAALEAPWTPLIAWIDVGGFWTWVSLVLGVLAWIALMRAFFAAYRVGAGLAAAELAFLALATAGVAWYQARDDAADARLREAPDAQVAAVLTEARLARQAVPIRVGAIGGGPPLVLGLLLAAIAGSKQHGARQ